MNPISSSSEKAGFPWPNCTPGSEEVQKQYPLLSKLRIPLGDTDVDRNCRATIMEQLLTFNDRQSIPNVITQGNNKKQTLVRLPRLQNVGFRQLHRLEQRTGFLNTIFQNMSEKRDVEENVGLLCMYLAKYYNAAFCGAIETAQDVRAKWLKKQPKEPLPEVTMYDGGDPEDPVHVTWNLRYYELLKFKEKHGHVMVPATTSKNLDPDDVPLSRWVQYQRGNYLKKSVTMTPKRIELLESVNFVWVVNPDQYKGLTDPRLHKTVAAKLFFQTTLTAKEAMLMSGFPEKDAVDDSRKKLMNKYVCEFYKKDFKIKEPVCDVLNTLQQLQPLDIKALESVFGASEILSELAQTSKLIPRDRNDGDNDNGDENHGSDNHEESSPADPPPAKKQRMEDDDDEEEEEANDHYQPPHSVRRMQPSLPFGQSRSAYAYGSWI